MQNQSILAIALLLTISNVSYAAMICDSITLKVVEAGSGLPVEYASARIKGRNTGFLSGQDGTLLMNLDHKYDNDTLSISCIGYETCDIKISDIRTDTTAFLSRRQFGLPEVYVTPRKYKTKLQGKKHSFGIASIPFYEKRGSIIGIESNAKKDRAQWLTKFGFYIKPTADRLSKMKFRISVYDATDVKGRESSAFQDYGIKPVYVDYTSAMIDNDKFVHTFEEPIYLPCKAMVAIEFLEDMGNERIVSRHNILGGGVWTSSPASKQWVKFPVATPFFIEVIQSK